MSGTDLFPDIPEEIRACRIGSCINSLNRSLMPYAATFSPSKLSGAGLLEFVHGTGRMVCQANSSSASYADGSFFAMDGKAEAKFFGCTASAGFSVARASKEVTSGQHISCFISYVYQGQKLQLLQADPETLYQCMREDFQRAYDRLMSAERAADYWRCYQEFTRKYGHGCVTALHLTAGSAFRIDIELGSTATSNSAKYGASVAVNTPYGGGAVAANWGREVGEAHAEASLSLIGQNIPEDAPTAEWCQQTMQPFLAKGVAMLSEAAQQISPPAVPSPRQPELPALQARDDKKKPSPKTNKDYTGKLKNELVGKTKYNSWDDYVRAQKEAYENLTAESVVEEAQSPAVQGPGPGSDGAPDRPQHTGFGEGRVLAGSRDGIGAAWDLGGYIPYAYEITPWSDLFPDLKLRLPQSMSSVYIAKMHTFYLTRLQFAQYLYFLRDVGPALCQNDSIAFDAARYVQHCDRLLDHIARVETFDEETYFDQLRRFELCLAEDRRFLSKTAYDKFFSLYEIFSNAPYGFIFVRAQPTPDGYIKGSFIYTCVAEHGWKDTPVPFSIGPMLHDAIRHYPLIDNAGTVRTVSYDDGWKETLGYDQWWETHRLRTDDKGNKNIPNPRDPDESQLYAVGFADIPPSTAKDGGVHVRGLPMFDEFPFEKLREFARPAEG